MPELPDLQIFSRNLQKELAGKEIKKVKITSSKIKIPASSLKESIEGARVTKVFREGKELRISFNNDNVLGLHLMLHGQLFIFEKINTHKYSILELLFEDETGFVMTDYQGAAMVSLNPEEKDVPDALSEKMNAAFLNSVLAKKKTNIKTALLDQHIIRGIGNAYADEILWEAGIAPASIASKIPSEKIKLLATSIKKVLKDGEKQILKTHPDIIGGEVRDFLKIHNAGKKESPTGKPIHQTLINSRKTYYTDEQELFQ